MVFNKIFDIFPPPKFLSPPFAGISISDTFIRCVKFGRKEGKLFIEKYAEREINPGFITSGQINNKEEVVKILMALKKDLNLDYVKISLPEEKAYLFTAKIPIVKQNEVRSAIESKIEENVPVSPSELTFDYKLIDHRKEDHLDVVVSVLPTNIVDAYVNLSESAGLSLLSLEIESQATARSLLTSNNSGVVLIVNFDIGKVGLYVIRDSVVHFTSTVLLKDKASSSFDFLSQEIKKLYVYWHTLKENLNKEDRKIKEIIICGEDFGDNAVQYFTTQNQTKSSLGNVWTNALDVNNTVPPISFKDSLRFAVSAGLALPQDILI